MKTIGTADAISYAMKEIEVTGQIFQNPNWKQRTSEDWLRMIVLQNDAMLRLLIVIARTVTTDETTGLSQEDTQILRDAYNRMHGIR